MTLVSQVAVNISEAECLKQLVTSAENVVEDDELENIVKEFGIQRQATKRLAILRNLAVRLGDVDQLRHLITSADQLHMDQMLADALDKAPPNKRKDIILLLLNQSDTKYEITANLSSRHHGKTAFHIAAEYGYHDLLTTLVPTKHENCNVLTSAGESALHCLIRQCNSKPDQENHRANLMTCIKILVDQLGIDINTLDNGDYSPIHLARLNKLDDIANYLKNKVKTSEICSDNVNTHFVNPISQEKPVNNIKYIFQLISEKKEDKFLYEFQKLKINVNANNGKVTLLQATVKYGLFNATKMLLDSGADINERCSDISTPVMLAVNDCNEQILELLLQYKTIDLSLVNSIQKQQTVLHLAVINATSECQCVKLLCDFKLNKTLSINSVDYRNKTALHYAVENHQENNIVYLLRNNANIFILSDEELPAFAGAELDSLHGYLDDQIIIEGSAYDKNGIYNMILDFQFLVTPTEKIPNNNIISSNESDKDKACLIEVPLSNSNGPDMKNLLLLAKTKVYKPLLNHPVIRSFLHLKWHRFFWLFYINFMMLAAFTTSFSVYIYYLVNDVNILHGLNNTSSDLIEQKLDNRAMVPQLLAGITLLFLVLRELFQIYVAVSFWHYISYIVNLVEVALIFISTFLLFVVPYDYHAIHTCSAVGILLAFSELVILIGSHPVLTIYYTMLFRVGKDFLYFLLWYSLLVVAFGISFYILFQPCESKEECSENMFKTIGTSIFKTTVMLQGEFDANNLKFDSFVITSHLIFLFFFFSMVIVLMNLLNGLAVSDIQIIKTEADIICMESQVKLYAKFENTIFNIINVRFKNLGSYLIQHSVLLSGLLKENKIQFTLTKQNSMNPDVRNSCNRTCFDCNSGKICGFNINCLSSKHFKKMFPLCFEFEKILEELLNVNKERCQFIKNFDAQNEDERISSKNKQMEERQLADVTLRQEILRQRQEQLEIDINMKLDSVLNLLEKKLGH